MADTAGVAERTLPHNLEAERSVLGAILIHNDAFNLAAEIISGADFYRDAHRRIFERGEGREVGVGLDRGQRHGLRQL
jgi:replicative DNA helicase